MSVQVVEDEVDDLALGDAASSRSRKSRKTSLGLVGVTIPDHPAGVNEEPGGEAASAATDVLDRSLAQLTRSGRKAIGKATLEGLGKVFSSAQTIGPSAGGWR